MQKNKMSNKATTIAYLVLAICATLFIASCSSEEPTLEVNDEFINSTQLSVWWGSGSGSDSTPIEVRFSNAEPNTYYKLARSTNSECDIQDEITCNDYRLLSEFTHTFDSPSSEYTHYDNFISTRQYYHLYVNFLEYDINDTLQNSFVYGDVPNRPNVHTTSAGNSEVYLDWDLAQGAISYDIYYSTSSAISPSNYQGSTSTTSTEITITSLTNETSYYFIVVGVNDNGMSDYNIEGSVTPSSNSPPSSPTNVSASAGNASVYLSWDATSNTDYYRIYYATFSGVHSSNYESSVDVSSSTSHTFDGLSNDITYYFVVYAVNSYGDSSSAEVFAIPSEDSTSLLPPSGIVATSGDRSISLTWNAVSVATSYNLYVAEEGGITIDNYSNLVGGVSYSTEETGYLLDNLINGTTHYLILTAVDADGNESIASSELSATPQLPLPSDFTVAASSGLVDLTWSADSGLTYEIYKTTDSACDLSAHDDFSQCSDSGGSTEATFPDAQSPIADDDVTNGTLYYYWFKAYRDSEYRYADRVSALPFDYAAGINFEEATHINLFTMSGDADWYIDDVSSGANGTSNSLRSGTISDGQSSCASFVGTVQDGNLHFYYRTDSESPDVLKLYLNGSEVSNFSGGAQAWTSVQREISAGEYTLMWCYEKDGSIATNSDAVWIDEIAFDTYVARDSMSGNYLNDTGISTSLSETEQTLVSCDLDSSSPQDCNSGRDSSDETNTSSDGSSGFSFTKIDADGNALASDASAWICVLDNVTGLLWQNASPGEYVNFSEISLDDSESICGRTGWRLPRLEELRSIVDYSHDNNSSADNANVDIAYFSNIAFYSYWSSTASDDRNYVINFSGGSSYSTSSNSENYYVLVNSTEDNSYLPDAWFDSRYIDNGDGTVSDKETNLIWQRCPHGMSWQSSNNTCSGSVQSRDWHSALTAAASDSTGDHSDWRIPNIKELASIVRYTGNSSPYVNTTIFPASDVFNQYSYLWSSSPYTNGAGAEVHGYSLNSREHSTSISNTNTYPYLLVRTNPQIYPNAPYNVEVIAGDGNVSLTWGNISTATSYRIYYSTNSGAGTSSDNNVSFTADMDEDSSDFTSTYTINGLTNGTIYFFVVTAIDEEGDESSASAQVSATPALPFPDDFSATGGNAQVMLNWTVTSDIGYAVHRSTNSACDVSSDTAANDCTDYATIAYVDGESTVDDGDDIINGTTYYYWLEASRSGDASRYSSAPISAIPNVLSSNRLNDTGINGAINSDGTRSTGCSSNLTGLQDCNIGRDADQDTNSSTDGHLGFNFTKLDSSGNELSASATSWECVRDNVTGLVWEKSSTSVSFASPPTIDDGFEKCGLTKWRYPRLGELISILNYGRDSGAMVDTDYFSNLSDSSTYYSSTAYSDNSETYGLSFFNGSTSTFLPDSNDYNYLLVTDAFNSSYLPDSWSESRYIISADGSEVSDIHTNLIWQRCVVGQVWDGSTCSGSADQLDLSNVLNAGDDEWRLPNVKELSSLAALDGGKRLNSTVFPDHIEAYHWSISNNHRNSGYLYVVNFNDSDNSSDLIGQFGWYDNVYYARLVKSVESPLPASPYGLEASAGDASATLTWSNISTATSYKMYYSETSGTSTGSDTFVDFNSSLDEDSSDSTSTYTVTGLSNGTTYYFVVTAIDGEGDESSASAQVNATPALPFPDDFSATGGNTQVTLDWTVTSGIDYVVHRSTDSACDVSSDTPADNCTDYATIAYVDGESTIDDGDDITNGTTYYYWLEASRSGDASRYSSAPIAAIPNVLSSNRLNDTGISAAVNSDGTLSQSCVSNIIGLQDCNTGRDAHQDTNSSLDGYLGFNFTKLDNSGKELLASATTWECVRDNVTGLVWEKSSTYISVASPPTIDDGFEKCGLTKWRYPRLGELISILNYGQTSGAMVDIDYFPGVVDSDIYYSSNVYHDDDSSYGLYLSNGTVSSFFPGSNFYRYLLVSDSFNSSYLPDSWANNRYIVSADGSEVSDVQTNLIWQRCSVGQIWDGSSCGGSANSLSLTEAMSSTNEEWRLPNIKELASLVVLNDEDYLNSSIFPAYSAAQYWTNSPSSRDSGYFYVVEFSGMSNVLNLTWYDNSYYARLVKSVESPLPASPYGLEASAGDASVTLTWSNISTASSYKIYYSETSGAGTSADNNVSFTADMDEDSSDSTSTYTIAGLSNGTTYYFVVTAIDGEGDESSASAQVSATPALPFPDDFSATGGNTQVTLDWTVTSGIGYVVHRSTDSACDVSSDTPADNCTDYATIAYVDGESTIDDGDDITNGTTYYYWLEASRSGDASRYSSAPVSATPNVLSSNRLNDTGISVAINSDGTLSGDCSSDISGLQDCHVGRDADQDTNSSIDGNLGFNFTKLDSSGNELSASATSWECVRDNVTGLVWEKSSTYVYFSSLPEIDASSETCGITGWRYPRLGELLSIVNYEESLGNMMLDSDYFSVQTSQSYHYSSTMHSGGGVFYGLYLFEGTVIYFDPNSTDAYYYLLVNDSLNSNYLPDSWGEGRYIISTDGSEVSDVQTNLIWQRCSVGQTWDGGTCNGSANTLDFANAINASSDEWRLPSVKELASLVPLGEGETINSSVFPNSPVDGSYWWTSSPSVVSSNSNIYTVDFSGSNNSHTINAQWYGNGHYARLVRSIESSLPASPYGLEASAGDASVTLTWSNISTATSYKIYYSATSGAGTSADNNVSFTADMDEDSSDSTSTYTINGLSNGTTYYFVITAIDGEGDESSASAQASATPSMPFPTNFQAEAGDGNATLTWQPADGDDGISYGVNRSTSATCYSNGQLADGCNDSTFIADSDVDNEIIDTGLSNGTRYYYWLEAIRGTESQIGSAPISVQPSSDGGYYDFEGNFVPSDFTMSGDADWYIDNSTGADVTGSTASLRSGVVGSGQSSCTSLTAYMEADNLSSEEFTFYYRLNTDGNSYLTVGINGDSPESIATSSTSGWEQHGIDLPDDSNDYIITWCYETSSSSVALIDYGAWIDEISFTPGLVLSAEQLADNYLNDTGVQFSGNTSSGNNDVCSDSDMEEDPQDCDVGRDSSADTSSTIDGAAGFAFTKLDSAGYELSADASSWACVRDDVTGLIWQNSVQTSTYQDITIDDSAEICGRSGWRLPTIEELRSIVNYGSSSPAVDSSYFSAIADGHSLAEFWTSTVFNYYGSNYYWQIDFDDGGDTNNYFTNSDRYMLVTSADNPDYLLERWPNNRYSDNGDGTVTDTYTNLIWMRCSLGQDWNSSSGACDEAASSFSWSGALNQARKSSHAEYDDWRLPNVKELTSLLKHTSSYPSINSTIFPNMPTDDGTNFWTSTPSVSTDSYSWLVDFYDYTGDTANNRVQEYYVRLVRSEETTAPAAPYGLNTEAGDQNISLDWQAISSVDNYRVYSATDSSLSIANYASLSNGAARDVNDSTSVTLDGLSNGTRHYLLVTAVDNAGTESIASPMVSATPQLPFPDDLAIDSADAALTLSWTPYADTTLGTISYKMYRSSDSSCDISAISNCAAGASFSVSSPFTDNNDSNGLANGIRYYYWLEAIRGSGASQESQISENPVSAIPAEVGVVHHDFAGSESDANFYSTPDSTPWYVDYSTGADGTGSSFRSGIIGDNSSSCVETYPRLDIGTLNFYYKIESESGADKLFFYVNDSAVSTSSGGISEISGVSGSVAWTQATYSVASAANYVLKWCYTKDASDEFGADAAWIDQLSFSGSADSYDPENLEMPLNDTGINWGGNSVSVNNIDCSYDMSVPQDCDQGRDADSSTNTDTDGHAGFSFTRLNADGTTFTGSGDYSTEPWHCVQDNVTGLIWEVKTNDGKLHNASDTYNWYNTDASTNGGSAGHPNDDSSICYAYDADNESTYCNTEAFVERVNSAELCGYNDWRMPDINELSSIVNLGRISPSIDTDYFPNTTNNYYWSASPSASSSGYAWWIYFYDGYDDTAFSSNNYRVRLVRSEQ